MSKSATVAATVVETSAVQGEQVQIDIGPAGPYMTANINVNPNIGTSTSPGIWAMPTNLGGPRSPATVGWTNISMTNVNANAPLPIYLVISPLQSTAGTNITLAGANTDTGVQVSSVNPSFIPAQSYWNSSGGEAPQFTLAPPTVWLGSSAVTQLEIGWV